MRVSEVKVSSLKRVQFSLSISIHIHLPQILADEALLPEEVQRKDYQRMLAQRQFLLER